MSLLVVSGIIDKYGFVKSVNCYDVERDEWKEVAQMNQFVKQAVVGYPSCVSDISNNFPFW